MININKKRQLNLLGIIIFILFWELIVFIERDPAIIHVTDVIAAIIKIIIDKHFLINLFSTLKITLTGIILSIMFGVVCGVAIDLSDTAKHLLTPVIELFRNIPSITLFPILLVIFGIGDFSRIFIIFWTSYPAILLQTTYGLSNIEKELIEAAQVTGASTKTIMKTIKFPLSIPNILNGIKIGIGSGFIAIVVAEMLGASKGLGYMLLWSTNAFKYDEAYAYIIVIGVVGVLVNGLMNILIKLYEKELYS